MRGQAPPREPVRKLNIVIMEGEGAVNNIKQRTARDPIVRVEDENHRPVAGATVTFLLPQSGPSATFPNGARTLTAFTDQTGRARALGLRPNSVPGKFTIQVNASSQGLTSSAVVAQTNVLAATAVAGAVSAKVIAILVIAGGAVAGGTLVVTGGKGGDKDDRKLPIPTTITSGAPRVVAP
jgi:hypothetical protein